VIGEPPFDVDEVHVTVAEVVLATVAFVMTGALGGNANGVTAFDGADDGEAPLALVAVTAKVYESPMVRLEMVHVSAVVVVQVSPPLARAVESSAVTV